MDVYENIKPVTYGRIDYTPDSDIDKSRIIKLPEGTPVDEVISTYFKKIGGKKVEEVVNPKEELAKDNLRKKFADNGFNCDMSWDKDKLISEFKKALDGKVEATTMSKENVISRLPADPLSVAELKEDTEESLQKKFEDNGFDCDKRWNVDTLRTKFEEAMKKKEDSENE